MILRILVPLTVVSVLLPRCCHSDPAVTTTAASSSSATAAAAADSDWESRVKVSCTAKQMKVTVSLNNHPHHHHHNDLNEGSSSSAEEQEGRRRRRRRKEESLVYLDKLKDYPSCQPVYDESSDTYSFDLPLDDDTFFTCGTSRLRNKVTGTMVFYHKIMIEQKILDGDSTSSSNNDENGKRTSSYSPSFSSSSSSSSPSSSHPSAPASGTASSSSTDSASSSPSSSSSSSSRIPDSHVKHSDQLHNRVRDRSSSALHASHDPSDTSSAATATAAGHADGSRDEDHDDHRSSAVRGVESEEEDDNWSQDTVTIRCIVPGDSSSAHHPYRRLRRQVITEPELPANFSESSEELIDFSGSVTGRAPMPLLNIAVKQNGEFVDTALNVSPGTPLEMVIYLDDVSSRVYGLLTTFLRVTDNTLRKQEEIIILNGCSIDPYIFANFETQDEGKSLSAKFRAFKFPESNYVLFVGTVNVCLKSCLGVQCGEGQIGYGRRKRSSYEPLPFDPNKVFEAELTAFIRVGESDQHKSSLSSLSNDPAIVSSSSSSESDQQLSANSKVSRDLARSHPLKWTSTPSDASGSSSRRTGDRKNSSIMTQTDLFLTFIITSIGITILSLTSVSHR